SFEQHRELVGMRPGELRHDAVPYPHEGYRGGGERVDQRLPCRSMRLHASLDPKSQAIKTPGRCPPHQQAKHEPNEGPTTHPPANLVVVASDKPHFVFDLFVLPIARA